MEMIKFIKGKIGEPKSDMIRFLVIFKLLSKKIKTPRDKMVLKNFFSSLTPLEVRLFYNFHKNKLGRRKFAKFIMSIPHDLILISHSKIDEYWSNENKKEAIL